MKDGGACPGTYLDLLARTAEALAARPAAEIDAVFEGALCGLVRALPDVDRSSLVQVSAAGGGIYLTHTFAVDPRPPAPRANLLDALPWYGAELLAGRTVCYADLPDGMPPAAHAERAYCTRIGFRANLTVPVCMDGRAVCAVAVGAFHAPVAWPPIAPTRLALLGHILAGAILRRRAAQPTAPVVARPDPAVVVDDLDGATRAHLLGVLDRCGWRIKGPGGAAARLGLAPSTLRWRMRRLGIVRPEPAQRERSST